MRELLSQFARWRADIARQLNENELWRQVVEFARFVCLPVTWLAARTLQIFPGLRKLEWLLEIETLTRRSPVVLSLSLLFVFWRGIMTTPLGHIGTDKLIYPTLGALSGFNPFLGMVCGATYGVADLIQKFFVPDMYGAEGWLDLNYWGAMVGYTVTYTTIMGMGLFPGMASRACRTLVVKMVRSAAAKRATRMADGAVPLGAPISPAWEMVAAATGGLAAGWGIMHQVAPITSMPAFLWRPNPDFSCWELEVDKHLKGYAAVGGAGAGAGGIGGIVVPPPGSKEPPEQQVPDEFEWTFPDGRTTVIRKDEDGQYINILTGGVVDVNDLAGWSQSWTNIRKEQREWGDEQMEKLRNRDTEFDRWIDEQEAERKLREKVWDNLSKMERNIITGDGPESQLYKPPGEPGNIIERIRELRDQLADRKPLDKERYEKIYDIYRKQKEGKILQPSQIPTESELRRDIFNNTIKNTTLEFVTGVDSDGNTSWKGIIGRGLTAAVTAGTSEIVLVPANALNSMKKYVDQGGDSTWEGFKQSVKTVLTDELYGRGLGAGIGVAVKGGSLIVKTGADLIQEVAERGSSLAKKIINRAQQGGKVVSKIVDIAKTPVGKKPLTNSTGAKVPKSVTPDPKRALRDQQRAGTRKVELAPSDKSVAEYSKGFTDKQVKHVKMVADQNGVRVDVRPTSEYARPWIESGKGVPKPRPLKTKTLDPFDNLLGARGKPGQVGYYRPKLPPKGQMPDELYEGLKKRYADRMKEFKQQRSDIKKFIREQNKPPKPPSELRPGELPRKGAYLEDGVIMQGKPPNGKPYVGDIDVFDIRDATTGKPLPRYQVDHKGNYIMDPATGQPKLNPVRQKVMRELGGPPANVQHDAHMDWKYDHKKPPPGTPPDSQLAKEYATTQKIDQGVLNKHTQGNPKGEPIISYGPNGQSEAVNIKASAPPQSAGIRSNV